jgi:HEAT repeat protein
MIRKRTIFVHDPHQELQEAACRALGKIGELSAVPYLARALLLSTPLLLMQNKSSKVRAAAAYALSNFPSDEARKTLDRAAHDPSGDVRSAASMALYNLDKKIPSGGETLLGPMEQ